MKKILIVDDEDIIRSSLSKLLRDNSYHTDEASSGHAALEKVSSQDVDIVILDQLMPDAGGLDVLADIKKIKPQTKVIMLTGFATIDSAVEAIKKGASEYLEKPYDPVELDVIIRRCLEEARFDECIRKLDLDITLSSLSNPIRRKIIKMLNNNRDMHLMKMTRDLDIEDHTKVVFHLKVLKVSEFIEQDKEKSYSLTKEGKKALTCLKIIEGHLSE